jgi:transcriptional regulator with XRE-family HTH domain
MTGVHGRKQKKLPSPKEVRLATRRISSDLWRSLEKLRKALGITHQDLAALLMLSVAQYSAMRKGKRALSLLSLLALSKSLGLALGVLANGKYREAHLKRCRAKLPSVFGGRFSAARK